MEKVVIPTKNPKLVLNGGGAISLFFPTPTQIGMHMVFQDGVEPMCLERRPSFKGFSFEEVVE
jgi:hypothetical protein